MIVKKLPVNAGGFLFMNRKTKNTEEPSLKKFSLFFIPLLFLIILLGGGLFWWSWANNASVSQSVNLESFVIKKGESISSIAQRLEEKKLIRSALAFKIKVRFSKLENKIQAGSFSLKSSLALQEILSILTHGTTDLWLTFPEGWRKEEFAQRLGANLSDFNTEEFLNLAENYEGELFPDTYLLPKEASPSVMLKFFLNNFQKKFTSDLESILTKSGLTKKEALILASLIERETKSDQDRPIVAGILLNRLRADWPLQIDATLQYALANLRCSSLKNDCDWWVVPTVADKKIVSPYNTYLNKGLPPAPICNPGLSSIKAVVYPQDSNYWFYISDLKGQMHYARTIEEHNANIQKYL